MNSKLIAGLGNPGRRYRHTPHNIGFEVIDELASRLGCSVRRSLRFRAQLGRGDINGQTVSLIKPMNYMNRSGPVINAVLRKYGMGASDLIVILDDADLELEQLRIRPRGSAGGHKGLQSIIESTGCDQFTRVRLGIGRSTDLVKHVLSPFTGQARKQMEQIIQRAADAVLAIMEQGVDAAMNRYNSIS